MTEEYKKNLLNLISGKAQDAILGSNGLENQLSTTEYDYSGILPQGATNVGLYGILDVPENLGDKSVLYGEYQLDSTWYGVVILIDENQTPIEALTEFDSGTMLRPIQKMIMDDTGNIYAVDGTLPGSLNYDAHYDYTNATIRFLMLNNFTVGTPGYEIKLRRSYNITGSVDVTGYNFFCRDMFKDPDGSSFVLVGSSAGQNTDMRVITLTINVGSPNEWTLYSQERDGWKLFEGCNVDYSGGDADFMAFTLHYSGSVVTLRKCTLPESGNTLVETELYSLPYGISSSMFLRPFSSYKFFSNNLGYMVVFYASKIDTILYWNFYAFEYKDGVLTNLYNEMSETSGGHGASTIYVVGDINNVSWLRYTFSDTTYSKINVYKSSPISTDWETGYYSFPDGSWEGYFNFDDLIVSGIDLPTYSVSNIEARKIIYTLSTKKTNFNLNYNYLFVTLLPTAEDGKYNVVENMFVPNGYSGSYPNYNLQDTYLNSLVPGQAIATHEEGEEVVTDFARNIYNVQIDDNISTSSVEVPHNYLNGSGNQIALYSKTNLPMINDYTMVKNQYEIVDVNFVNSITVINNNDDAGIYNQECANKVNRAVTVGADYSYYLSKILINYTDDTQKIKNVEVEIDDDTHARAIILIYVDKEIDSIEFVDESTQFIEGGSVLVKGFTYQTIDGSSLEVGKFYNITQPFHIE